MDTLEGIVILTQESRFQLLDRSGVGHHFILGYRCAADPEQLPLLQREQTRVRVQYRQAPDLIGHIAERIDMLDA